MIALLSDVHGNLAALQAVLGRVDALGAEAILCLGDTAGYYPDVDACCAELRRRDATAVRGNHDHYLATGARSGRSRWADLCIDQQAGTVTPTTVAWLASLPSAATCHGISAVHGGWTDPLDEYLLRVERDAFPPDATGCLASGHTHRPVVWTGDGITYCNPGSVGQPRDGDPRASFAWFDGRRFGIERVPYDIERTRHAVARAGLPPEVAANLDVGRGIGARR